MRRAALLLLLPILAAVVAGCGAGNSIDPVAQAAEATQAVNGAHMEMHMTLEAGGQAIPFTAQGDMSTKPPARGHIAMDMSGLAKLPGAKASAKDAHMEMVMTGNTIYMSSPLFEKELPDGKSWMKIDIQKAAKRLGFDFQSLQQTGGNLGDQIAQLRAASHTKKLGSETIDGVPTTHYHAVVNLRDYPKLVPESRRDEAKRSIENLIKASGQSSYPIDVWVDSKKRVRREVLHQTMNTGGQKLKMRIQTDLSRFGEKVTTKAPPASETVDVTKLASPPGNPG